MIHNELPRYRAFMLRCWEVRTSDPGDPATWRFSLEDPDSRQKHGFADLEALVAFLGDELGRPPSRVGASPNS